MEKASVVSSFVDAIDEQTRIVAVTQVCFRNGAKLDIPAIAALAREKQIDEVATWLTHRYFQDSWRLLRAVRALYPEVAASARLARGSTYCLDA